MFHPLKKQTFLGLFRFMVYIKKETFLDIYRNILTKSTVVGAQHII